MRLQRLRLELRMELAAEEVRMARDFHDLDISCVGRGAAQPQSAASKQRFVLAIELVPVPVPLADLRRSAVGLGSQRILLQDAGPRAQPHGAAHLFHTQQFTQLVNDAVLRGRVELA